MIRHSEIANIKIIPNSLLYNYYKIAGTSKDTHPTGGGALDIYLTSSLHFPGHNEAVKIICDYDPTNQYTFDDLADPVTLRQFSVNNNKEHQGLCNPNLSRTGAYWFYVAGHNHATVEAKFLARGSILVNYDQSAQHSGGWVQHGVEPIINTTAYGWAFVSVNEDEKPYIVRSPEWMDSGAYTLSRAEWQGVFGTTDPTLGMLHMGKEYSFDNVKALSYQKNYKNKTSRTKSGVFNSYYNNNAKLTTSDGSVNYFGEERVWKITWGGLSWDDIAECLDMLKESYGSAIPVLVFIVPHEYLASGDTDDLDADGHDFVFCRITSFNHTQVAPDSWDVNVELTEYLSFLDDEVT